MATINGKACVANGNTVDKVFSNGRQVYGRNILLDTDFNNLPQYWTGRAGTVTGTFNGHNVIYYDATKLTISYANVLEQPIYDPSLTNNRVLPSHWYTLSFYAKGVGQMASYIYSSFVDPSAGSYIDGVKTGVTKDGSRYWNLTDGWTRHTYAIKSMASLSNTDMQNVLFRTFKGNNEIYICMPKLEEGTLATPWSPAPEDVM